MVSKRLFIVMLALFPLSFIGVPQNALSNESLLAHNVCGNNAVCCAAMACRQARQMMRQNKWSELYNFFAGFT